MTATAGGFRPTLTEEQLLEIVNTYKQHNGNAQATADFLGVSRNTVNHHLKRAGRLGLLGYEPVIPGFEVSRVSTTKNSAGATISTSVTQRQQPAEEDFNMPAGQALRRGTFHLSADGKLRQQWLKTGRDEIDPAEFLAGLLDAFEEKVSPHEPTKAPVLVAEDSMTLLPLADLHLGMHVWGKDASENWDLKIARRVITNTVGAIVAQSQPSELGVILGGGDQTHANDGTNRTQASGHLLNVDGRFKKTSLESGLMWVDLVNIHLGVHRKVLIRILPGNHDPEASHSLAMFLLAWFRNDPRVEVDLDPSWFWFHRWGDVFSAATHGDKTPLVKLPSKMAVQMPELWGATKHRYGHGFHLHKAEKSLLPEEDGVLLERHRTIIPSDNYAYDHSFLSGRSAQSISYDKKHGEVARVVRRPIY